MKTLFYLFLFLGTYSSIAQYHLKQVIGKTDHPVISDYWRTPVATSETTLAYNDKNETVIVYEKLNGKWEFFQTINEPNSNRNTSFGEFISIENNVMAISDRATGDNEGTVFFYKKQIGSDWVKFDSVHTPLNPNTSSSPYWGSGLRLKNGTCPVGRTNGNMTYFHIMRENNDGSWYLADTISTPTMVTGNFENTDSTLFITGKYFFGLNHIFAYTKNNNGSINETPQKITIPNDDGVYRLGNDMEAEGEFLFAGSPADDIFSSTDTTVDAGTVFIFKKENGIWSYYNRIFSPNSLKSGQFGESIDIRNGELIIGEKGSQSGYIYTLQNDEWTLTQTINASDFPTNSTNFGKHIHFAGNDIVISNSFGIHIYNKADLDCDNISKGMAFIDPCGRCSEGSTNTSAQENTNDCEPILGTENNIESSITIYPNPVSNKVMVTGGNIASLELISLSGVSIKESQSTSLKLNDIQNGIYLLRVTTSSGVQIIERIVKQ